MKDEIKLTLRDIKETCAVRIDYDYDVYGMMYKIVFMKNNKRVYWNVPAESAVKKYFIPSRDNIYSLAIPEEIEAQLILEGIC